MPRKKKDEILLSEKHGVNPSITTCFYCGEATGIALMGKLKGDVEAPKECCCSLEPCDKCKEKWKNHLLVVEVFNESRNPTGRWFAINKSVVSDAYKNTPVALSLEDDFNEMIKGCDVNESDS